MHSLHEEKRAEGHHLLWHVLNCTCIVSFAYLYLFILTSNGSWHDSASCNTTGLQRAECTILQQRDEVLRPACMCCASWKHVGDFWTVLTDAVTQSVKKNDNQSSINVVNIIAQNTRKKCYFNTVWLLTATDFHLVIWPSLNHFHLNYFQTHLIHHCRSWLFFISSIASLTQYSSSVFFMWLQSPFWLSAFTSARACFVSSNFNSKKSLLLHYHFYHFHPCNICWVHFIHVRW